MTPRLLDLFCGAGGAAMGYHRAGFEVTGVDIAPQPRFPFRFVQADALAYLAEYGHQYDAIHASPPCQGYSRLRHLPWLKDRTWPLLIEPCRALLRASGAVWVMENVEDAPLDGITLCGRSFGLPLYRHRVFESSVLLLAPPHQKHDVVIGHGRMVNDRRRGTLNASSSKGAWGNQTIITVAGGQFRKADGERAMGIDWMTKDELAEAIPPAYTELVGRQLIAYVKPSAPAWVPCHDCDAFFCTHHGTHAYDCACPEIQDWETDPYEEAPDAREKEPMARAACSVSRDHHAPAD